MFLTGYQTDFRGYLTYFCRLTLQLGFSKKFQIYWLSPMVINKVGRCLARYSPRAKANNTIPCNTIRYNAMT